MTAQGIAAGRPNTGLVSAAVKFGVLGTLGEVISRSIARDTLTLFDGYEEAALKVFSWMILGTFIKVGFMLMSAGKAYLVELNMLPNSFEGGLRHALSLSVITNVFFGPALMVIHRLMDCLIYDTVNWAGLEIALFSLLWFWIPAHTLTFLLRKLTHQITLAAVWSLMLGAILGWSAAHI